MAPLCYSDRTGEDMNVSRENTITKRTFGGFTQIRQNQNRYWVQIFGRSEREVSVVLSDHPNLRETVGSGKDCEE